MARHKRRRINDMGVGSLIGGGMLASAGSMALGGMGAPGANAAAGIANMSTAFPTVGTVGGLGMVMKSISSLKPRRRK